MSSINLYINLDDVNRVVSGARNLSPNSGVRLKGETGTKVTFRFLSGGVVTSLGTSPDFHFAAKVENERDSDPILEQLNSSFTIVDSDPADWHVEMALDTGTAELRALFAEDSNAANDNLLVKLDAELLWTVGGDQSRTPSGFQLLMENPVIKDSDLPPVPDDSTYPDPSTILVSSDLGVTVATQASVDSLSANKADASDLATLTADVATRATTTALATLTSDVALKALKVNVQSFTANGTWTKPAGALFCVIELIGQGGGGGSGRRGAAASACYGGGAGSGGSRFIASVLASSLSATESITLNTAGVGGAAITVDSTSGNAGTAGADTVFGTKFRAVGGLGGTGGTAAAGTAGVAQVGGFAGGAGSNGAGVAGEPSTAVLQTKTGAPGGGGGGGITTGNVVSGGAIGGNNYYVPSTPNGGAAGVAAGGAGGNGTDAPASVATNGTGGGGGAAAAATAAGAGGNGGKYGAGGGGGGASNNGFNSGKGGDGGLGICVVTTYF
jgi:hypothetical protein